MHSKSTGNSQSATSAPLKDNWLIWIHAFLYIERILKVVTVLWSCLLWTVTFMPFPSLGSFHSLTPPLPCFYFFFFLQTVPISPHWYHQHSPSSDCRNRRSNCFAAQNGWVALDKTMSKNLLWTCLCQFALGTTGTFAGATPPLALLRKRAVQRDLIRQCFLTVNANHLTCYFLQRWIKTDHFGISPDFVRILVRIHRSVLWTLFFVITVLKVIYCWKAGTVVVLV